MTDEWQPGVSREILVMRAALLQTIREFMAAQGVLEVETPVLGHAAPTDPNIQSFSTVYQSPSQTDAEVLFLHTSPEFAMKRLLASGSGPVYQISRVFRNEESGKFHNPEFTMLEWYQPGFGCRELMNQLNDLLQRLQLQPAETRTYEELFVSVTGINPHTADLRELQSLAQELGLVSRSNDRSDLLDFIFSHKVFPVPGQARPIFVTEFPACQCALARISGTEPPVAERFELFINGIEIANGYHELCDASEQRQRFEADLERRKKAGKQLNPLDEKFLQALSAGLPPCAGVSVGLDRLLMVMHGLQSIADVLPFPVDRI